MCAFLALLLSLVTSPSCSFSSLRWVSSETSCNSSALVTYKHKKKRLMRFQPRWMQKWKPLWFHDYILLCSNLPFQPYKMACEQFGYSEHQMGLLPSDWTSLLMVTLSNNNLEDALCNCKHIYRYTGINIAPLLTLHFKRSSFRQNSSSHWKNK